MSDATRTPTTALAAALHPKGKGPTVDCCMGSTVREVYPPDEAEARHDGYHHDDAVALVAELAKQGVILMPREVLESEVGTMRADAIIAELTSG